ncbi:hypothetical protein E3G47_000780 [Mycobacteroides abscessus]|nr:hypothetical protein [Mycobacteroides abscessus]
MPTSASSVPYPSTDGNTPPARRMATRSACERTPERGGGEAWAEHGAPAPRAGQRSVSRSPERGGGSESAAVVASAAGSRAQGLVIYAKSRRETAPATKPQVSHVPDLPVVGLRFPSPELVTSAAAMFPGLEVEPAAWARRFRVEIAPGAVRLLTQSGAVASTIDAGSRSGERRQSRDRARVDDDVHGERVDQIGSALGGATVVESTMTPSDCAGRSITEWSRKSRSAMCRAFAQLDYTPIIASGRVPAMVTLTYPGEWLTVAPSGRSVKRHMDLWRKQFEREFGEKARYIWKLEFQRRGAPHIHLWTAPPSRSGRSGLSFRAWCSRSWAAVVAHPDPAQRARHELAGTAVDVLEGLRASDPKRLAVYFTKHSSPNMLGDKEYQHVVPIEWRASGKGPGRFWGVYGLEKAIAPAELAEDDYIRARRIMRRWARHTAAYGSVANPYPTAVCPRTAVIRVPRVDQDTGRVRYRTVRRRRKLFGRSDYGGGFALVNNGPAFAAQLARALMATE